MRFLSKLGGLFLLLIGIYFLGQNILFTTYVTRSWWRDISAAASVIATVVGVLVLLFGGRNRPFGWILVGLGILLVFVSGGVVLKPTSLWTLFISLIASIGGWSLLRTGRIGL